MHAVHVNLINQEEYFHFEDIYMVWIVFSFLIADLTATVPVGIQVPQADICVRLFRFLGDVTSLIWFRHCVYVVFL